MYLELGLYLIFQINNFITLNFFETLNYKQKVFTEII